MKEVVITFKCLSAEPAVIIADDFMTWLCGQGEQDYWQWAECQDDSRGRNTSFAYDWNLGTITVTEYVEED